MAKQLNGWSHLNMGEVSKIKKHPGHQHQHQDDDQMTKKLDEMPRCRQCWGCWAILWTPLPSPPARWWRRCKTKYYFSRWPGYRSTFQFDEKQTRLCWLPHLRFKIITIPPLWPPNAAIDTMTPFFSVEISAPPFFRLPSQHWWHKGIPARLWQGCFVVKVRKVLKLFLWSVV